MPNTKSIDLERGSLQMLYRADTVSLSITGDLTIEMWLKPESINLWQQLCTKFRAADGTLLFSWEFILRGDSNKLRFGASNDGAAPPDASSDTALATGSWYHVAVVYDASAGQCWFYLNGAADGGGTGLDTSIQDNASEFTIGGERSSNPTNPFDGLIDEVRIWNDIRTAAEILANKSWQLLGNEANLVAYFKLNDAAIDATINANDLTLKNAPVYSVDVPFTADKAEGGAFLLALI